MTKAKSPGEKTVDMKSIHRIEFSADDIVQPGTVFACPVGQVQWLKDNGAITDVKRLTALDAQAMAEPAPAMEDADDDEIPLDEMTDAALADVAKGLGLKVGKKKRAAILKMIVAYQGEALAADEDDPSGLV